MEWGPSSLKLNDEMERRIQKLVLDLSPPDKKRLKQVGEVLSELGEISEHVTTFKDRMFMNHILTLLPTG